MDVDYKVGTASIIMVAGGPTYKRYLVLLVEERAHLRPVAAVHQVGGQHHLGARIVHQPGMQEILLGPEEALRRQPVAPAFFVRRARAICGRSGCRG